VHRLYWLLAVLLDVKAVAGNGQVPDEQRRNKPAFAGFTPLRAAGPTCQDHRKYRKGGTSIAIVKV
jgi:hypothetical protein